MRSVTHSQQQSASARSTFPVADVKTMSLIDPVVDQPCCMNLQNLAFTPPVKPGSSL
jgi:hypothetical protein